MTLPNQFSGPPSRAVPLSEEPVFFNRDGHGTNGYAYGSAYAQAGVSLARVEGMDQVVMGAPGAWNWSGTPVL